MAEFDIAIVGMGPVGSTAASFFAHAGMKVAAFERDPKIYTLPRAVAMDGEVVRNFQSIRQADQLAALLQAQRPGEEVGFANSHRELLFSQPLPDFGPDGWPPTSFFDQPEVDGYLRTLATSQSAATVFLGDEVLGFQDDGNEVKIRVRRAGQKETTQITAKYLLGCDGAASSIRNQLGVGWHDLGYDQDWLVVDIILGEGHTLGHQTVQVCDPDRISTYVATKDPYRRWEFRLNPGETREEMLHPEKIQQLITPWTAPGTYKIRRTAVYQFHAAVADSWRVGRVLLAGDAAHQTPPFLGQGMNAGMRDTFNLAWKLSLVLTGNAGEELLDSYQSERAPHATDLVEWAVAIGHLMEHFAATEEAARRGTPPPDLPPDQRAAGYGQGRTMPPLGPGVSIDEQLKAQTSTGFLFAQPEVRNPKGDIQRLDELLGPGFAIVTRSPTDLSLNSESQALIERLGIRTTHIGNLSEVRGKFDPLFANATTAIVRPDRYVFGHTTESMSLDQLLAELGRKLHLR